MCESASLLFAHGKEGKKSFRSMILLLGRMIYVALTLALENLGIGLLGMIRVMAGSGGGVKTH